MIWRMSMENPLWGAQRIHGQLLKLGFEVAQSSVAKYMVKPLGPPSQGWRTFLHLSWASTSTPDSEILRSLLRRARTWLWTRMPPIAHRKEGRRILCYPVLGGIPSRICPDFISDRARPAMTSVLSRPGSSARWGPTNSTTDAALKSAAPEAVVHILINRGAALVPGYICVPPVFGSQFPKTDETHCSRIIWSKV